MRRIVKVIRRDLGAQFRVSRNMDERGLKKLQRARWALVFTMRGVWAGIKAMRHEQLGSAVIYNGRRCYISNWSNTPSPTLAGKDGFYKRQVPRSDFTNIVDAKELYHRFCTIFSWYMSSWHGIAVNRRLYPEMFARI